MTDSFPEAKHEILLLYPFFIHTQAL